MAFVTIPNDKPISRHSPNLSWCKLADKKICLVYHTASSSAGALVFVQIANFTDNGDISFETPIYVTTIPVACRFTFVDICAISATKVCISYPVESVASQGDISRAQASSEATGAFMTPTLCNLAFIDLDTGLVDRTLPVPFAAAHYTTHATQSSFRQNPPVLHFDGTHVVVQSSPTMWKTRSDSSVNIYLFRLPRYKINPATYEVSVTTYTTVPYTATDWSASPMRQIQNFYFKNGIFVSRAASVIGIGVTYANLNICREEGSTIRASSSNTYAEYIYPMDNKYLLFTKSGNNDNMKWFDYNNVELASTLIGSNYNFDTAIDVERTDDDTLLILKTTASSYVAHGTAQQANENVGPVQGSMYSILQIGVFKIYPDLNFLNAPPPNVELQTLPFVVRDIGQYSKRTIFQVSDKVIALIGCFYQPIGVFGVPQFNLEKPGIVTLKV